ncbi:hypothetical protein GHK62_13535 [Sinorhizobium terangae]|uniref:Uncharacterized protein n=1 Tax=Sinorhizobium terangae TaxID=110322 RepID=A0A6N7LEV9_SINTE|nr:hypothetical protein [Sinorhizobium terangae]
MPRLSSHGRFSGLQESLQTLDLLFHRYALGVHLSREIYVPRIGLNTFVSGVRPHLIHTPFDIGRFLRRKTAHWLISL